MIAPREAFSQADREPLYSVGTLVRHVLYGYRGVVVACDAACQAPDNWYLKNKTQPTKNQPWYHLLVDGSDQNTYVAESNLMPDDSGECVVHPWVNLYFSHFEGHGYRRNDTPWPEIW